MSQGLMMLPKRHVRVPPYTPGHIRFVVYSGLTVLLSLCMGKPALLVV